MLWRVVYSLCLVLLVACGLGTSATAQPATDAGQVPPRVAEVTSGGSWTDGKAHGTFRAIVVEAGTAEKHAAEVFLQWISPDASGRPSGIVASIPIKEFNALAHSHASLRLDDTVDGEIQLYIDTEDAGAQPVEIRIFATTPGHYAIISDPAAAPKPAQ